MVKLLLVTSLLMGATLSGQRATAAGADAGAERAALATVAAPGEEIQPGDMLRTTRMFPNWNLNCEVQLSTRRHLCAVEQSLVDQQGDAVLTWSVAMGSSGAPVLAFRTAPDIDRRNGIRLGIGALTMTVPLRDDQCSARACLAVVLFDEALRAAMSSQTVIHVTMTRGPSTLTAEGPLAGMADALGAAKTDPIGILAVSRAAVSPPAAERPRQSRKRSASK